MPDNAREEIEDVSGLTPPHAVLASAKTGLGRGYLSRSSSAFRLVGDPDAPFKARLFDSWFDNCCHVVMLVRVIDEVRGLKTKDLC